MQIHTIPLWTINVHKIHIKEWALVKNKLLSIIPWDELNLRKNKFARENLNASEHEMTWTNYFLQGSEDADCYEMDDYGINLETPVRYISSSAQYEPVFLSMISPYLTEFLKIADYKFCEVSRVWTQR